MTVWHQCHLQGLRVDLDMTQITVKELIQILGRAVCGCFIFQQATYFMTMLSTKLNVRRKHKNSFITSCCRVSENLKDYYNNQAMTVKRFCKFMKKRYSSGKWLQKSLLHALDGGNNFPIHLERILYRCETSTSTGGTDLLFQVLHFIVAKP